MDSEERALRVPLNYKGLPLSSPFHPPYVDPLFRPYEDKKRERYSCNTSVFKRNPPYPIVDPKRMRVGEGVHYRSQYDNYCSPGFRMGPNQQCYAVDEAIGHFYEKAFDNRYPTIPPVKDYKDECLRGCTQDPRYW